MSDENERINKLSERQIETSTLLTVAQQNINRVAEIQRDDAIALKKADERIEEKVDLHATDLKIYKIIIGLISSAILGIVAIAAWLIQNIDNLRSLTK